MAILQEGKQVRNSLLTAIEAPIPSAQAAAGTSSDGRSSTTPLAGRTVWRLRLSAEIFACFIRAEAQLQLLKDVRFVLAELLPADQRSRSVLLPRR